MSPALSCPARPCMLPVPSAPADALFTPSAAQLLPRVPRGLGRWYKHAANEDDAWRGTARVAARRSCCVDGHMEAHLHLCTLVQPLPILPRFVPHLSPHFLASAAGATLVPHRLAAAPRHRLRWLGGWQLRLYLGPRGRAPPNPDSDTRGFGGKRGVHLGRRPLSILHLVRSVQDGSPSGARGHRPTRPIIR